MSQLKRNVCDPPPIEGVARHLSGTPQPTFWSKWFGGLIVPVVLTIYATRCCIWQQGVFIGKGILRVTGKTAVFLGLAWLSGAAFLHFHYFWPTLKRLYIFADAGKVISLFCWLGTFGYVDWLILMR